MCIRIYICTIKSSPSNPWFQPRPTPSSPLPSQGLHPRTLPHSILWHAWGQYALAPVLLRPPNTSAFSLARSRPTAHRLDVFPPYSPAEEECYSSDDPFEIVRDQKDGGSATTRSKMSCVSWACSTDLQRECKVSRSAHWIEVGALWRSGKYCAGLCAFSSWSGGNIT